MTETIRWMLSGLVAASLLMGCGNSEESEEPAEPTTAAEAPTEPAAEELAEPAAEPAAEGTTYTCNQLETNKLCYTVSPPAALVAGQEAGCAAGEWSEGESCPEENVVAKCEKDQFGEVRRFYEGVDMENAETACTTFGGTFTAME